jgi:hypothetical protein
MNKSLSIPTPLLLHQCFHLILREEGKTRQLFAKFFRERFFLTSIANSPLLVKVLLPCSQRREWRRTRAMRLWYQKLVEPFKAAKISLVPAKMQANITTNPKEPNHFLIVTYIWNRVQPGTGSSGYSTEQEGRK